MSSASSRTTLVVRLVGAILIEKNDEQAVTSATWSPRPKAKRYRQLRRIAAIHSVSSVTVTVILCCAVNSRFADPPAA